MDEPKKRRLSGEKESVKRCARCKASDRLCSLLGKDVFAEWGIIESYTVYPKLVSCMENLWLI
jgi:hypothetical protein